MADFLDTFKRHESSSEESGAEDEYEGDFAKEELRHHSDDEDNNTRSRPQGGSYKQHTHEERKEVEGRDQKNRSPHTEQQKKKDYYLYAGEEKPYESDSEEQGQDGNKNAKKENQKNEKKDPTFVPKGSFYQHDTRGDDVEYAPKKGSDKLKNSKWKHDKYERNYNQGGRSNKGGQQQENIGYGDKRTMVYYVAKGENQDQQKLQEEQQQQQGQGQPQKPRQNYNKPSQNKGSNYNKDRNYDNNKQDRNRGYNQDRGSKGQNRQQQQHDYVKKDNYNKRGGNKEYVVEYVVKKPEAQ